MGFKKAVRENIWVKVCLIAPSGGGKSYSTLRMAEGFSKALKDKDGEEHRVAYIGTEKSRDKYYANEFDYDLDQISKDYSPEKYIDKIEDALENGYDIIVVDSISHEWVGTGGCLEIHSKMPGNTYTNWNKVTPRHNKLMDLILDCDAHVIVTVRGKDKYVMEEVNGRQTVSKKNLGYQQRDDFEYLFTLSLNIDKDTHVFTNLKDNTHLFEDRNNDVITEKDGSKLIEWASSGNVSEKIEQIEKAKEEAKQRIALNEEEEAKKMADEVEKKKKKQENKLTLDELKADILLKCKELSDQGKRDIVISTLKDLNKSPNPNDIKSKSIAEKVIEAFDKLA